MPLDLAPLKLDQPLGAALQTVRLLAQQKNVELVEQIGEHLPRVQLDRVHGEHALAALLLHGLSRTPEGGRLTLRVRQEGGRIHVGVTDSGPWDSALEKTAFARDQRVAREGRLTEGFELCVAKDEIEAMGGQAGLEHAEGATFYFTLPCSSGEEAVDDYT